MEIDWGSVIGGMTGGVLVVVGGVAGWYLARGWDLKRDRRLALQRWARRVAGSIRETRRALRRYETDRSRAVLADLCFNFLHVHDEAAAGVQEGFDRELEQKDEAMAAEFHALAEVADRVLHSMRLGGGLFAPWAGVPLDSIRHGDREYAIARSQRVLRIAARAVRDELAPGVDRWMGLAGWLTEVGQ